MRSSILHGALMTISIQPDGKLAILHDAFTIDPLLPKWKRKVGKVSMTMRTNDDGEQEVGILMGNTQNIVRPSFEIFEGENGMIRSIVLGSKQPWWRRLVDTIRGWFVAKPKAISVIDFFQQMKGSTEQLAILEDYAKKYERAIREAEATGQIALVQMLMERADVLKAEAELIAIGGVKYIQEDVVALFVKKTDRGVSLDYIRHFLRPLPADLLVKKAHLDEIGIFDNYAVMHFDPKGVSTGKTQEEKKEEQRRKRDPILFGLIQGSDRLYYLGDWIDEYCDLTLDKIVEKLGTDPTRQLGREA
jgi:hypothetical protein